LFCSGFRDAPLVNGVKPFAVPRFAKKPRGQSSWQRRGRSRRVRSSTIEPEPGRISWQPRATTKVGTSVSTSAGATETDLRALAAVTFADPSHVRLIVAAIYACLCSWIHAEPWRLACIGVEVGDS
jgi:hypothetical protein